MKIKKINPKFDTDQKLLLFVGNWLVILGILLCLTTLHVTAEEAPDAEVVQEADQTSDAPPDNTEADSSATSDQQGDETETEQVKVTKEVITGTSDRMERDEKVGITILIGNAKTKRHSEDGIEIGFLNADTITIKNNPETGETTEIVAVGNVEIRDDKIFATCDHATMDNLTSIITLKDNVVVLQNKDRLETKLFTFNRITGKQTGIGGVKFKVEVTQATPTESAEESEETDSDNKDATESTGNTDKKTDASETKKEEQEKSDGNSDKSDSKEKAAPTDKAKEEAESKENSEAENNESEEKEQSESEEKDEAESEDTGEEETQE